MDCTIRIAKTKALISFAVTAKLICFFIFAYAKSWFSQEAVQETSFCRCLLSQAINNEDITEHVLQRRSLKL